MKSLQQHLNEALNNQMVIYDEKKHLVTYPMSRQDGWEEFCEENDIVIYDIINQTAITFDYDKDVVMVETPMGPERMNVYTFKSKKRLVDYYKQYIPILKPDDLKEFKVPRNNDDSALTFIKAAICWTFNTTPEPLFDEPVK